MEEEKAIQRGKKQRHRSPNYPAVRLREAVERVRKLYEQDPKAGAPPEIAAMHISFAKPHGQAMSVLAALRRFGLVTEVNGRLAPNQRAIEILNLPEGDERRKKPRKDAAVSPEVYRQLIEDHLETGFPAADHAKGTGYLQKLQPSQRKGIRWRIPAHFRGISDLSALL